AFDHPASPDSPLRRLDPRWKLVALVPAAAVAATLRTLPAAAVALAAALVLAVVARLPLKWYLRRLAALGPFLGLFVALLPFFVHGPGPVWEVGPLRLSSYGVVVAVRLTLQALAVVTLMLVLLATAPLEATFKAAHALRVPGLLVQLAVLTYRY